MSNYHFLVTLPFILLTMLGLFGIFKKAGEKGWKAFVPVLNILIWLKIVGRPQWWLALLFVPVVNFIIGIGLSLDLVKSFGIEKFWKQALAILAPWLYFPWLGFNTSDKYVGPWTDLAKTKQIKKSEGREWADAILFAGTAALIIRSFMIEAFMIPTTSMEGSLLAGDFLFVSKMHYGIRLPMVPLSVPFIHNRIPGTDSKSYLDWLVFPYARIPGFREVTRNDIVVFNYPGDDEYPDVPEIGPIPEISMKQNYIKRCVAVAGDTLEIQDQVLMIDGKEAWKPENLQYKYYVISNVDFSSRWLMDHGFRFNKGMRNQNDNVIQVGKGHYLFYMNEKKAEMIKALNYVQQVQLTTARKGAVEDVAGQAKYMIYPKNLKQFPWNVNNFGPLYVPKAGTSIELSPENITLYRRCISAYEGHKLRVEGQQVFIDDKEATTYTFEMDYYFMMGDNRHASLDSRYWGFVPEDHVVGRPLMVLMSVENGMRWERLFTGISHWEPDGE